MRKSSIALRQLITWNEKKASFDAFVFLPQNACGRFTLVECDAMRAGTSHYPYTSATHDLFPAAKVRTIFESSTVFVCFFQSSPFPVSRIELAGLRLGAAPLVLYWGCGCHGVTALQKFV